MGYRLAQSILDDSSSFLYEGIVQKELEARLREEIASAERAEAVPELARS
jgi:hypothetical protein